MSLLDAAKISLCEEGYVDLNDSRVGELVSQMEQRDFPYFSRYGLDYCKRHILDDEVMIQQIYFGLFLITLSVSKGSLSLS
jgi:hypothetical protein